MNKTNEAWEWYVSKYGSKYPAVNQQCRERWKEKMPSKPIKCECVHEYKIDKYGGKTVCCEKNFTHYTSFKEIGRKRFCPSCIRETARLMYARRREEKRCEKAEFLGLSGTLLSGR